MTVDTMSSARTNHHCDHDPESDDDDAARDTEEFLAGLMHATYVQPHEAYPSPEYEPVHIDANMFTDDDSLWILATEDRPPMNQAAPSALPARSDLRPDAASDQLTTRTFRQGIRSSDARADRERQADSRVTRHQRVESQDQRSFRDKVAPYHPVNLLESERKRTRYPHNYLRETGAINPSDRPEETPLSYLQAFQADLTTIQDVDRHETRIYQPGYTPDHIRRNIKHQAHPENSRAGPTYG